MYMIPCDSVITSIVSNAIAVLVLRIAKRLCFVMLKVTHVWREDPRTKVNTPLRRPLRQVQTCCGVAFKRADELSACGSFFWARFER